MNNKMNLARIGLLATAGALVLYFWTNASSDQDPKIQYPDATEKIDSDDMVDDLFDTLDKIP